MNTRRYTPAVLATLAGRLTPRDRRILRMIWDHRVLTAPQIAQLAYDSEDTARKRLLRLHRMGVVDRFAPNLPRGSGAAPYHYVLGEAGAAVLACEDGIDVKDFGYRRERVLSVAYSQTLAHTVGVNGFFTALVAHTRRVPLASVERWWPEHRCRAQWGETARSDAYGRWTENGQMLDFFLEYDNGTETLDRVARKLVSYYALTQQSGITTPVLFWLPGERREANLRKRLLQQDEHHAVPIATACGSALTGPIDDGPAGPLWLPLGTRSPRLRLAGLAAHWPALAPRFQHDDHGEEDER